MSKNGHLWKGVEEGRREVMMLVREAGNIHRKRRVGSVQLDSINLMA